MRRIKAEVEGLIVSVLSHECIACFDTAFELNSQKSDEWLEKAHRLDTIIDRIRAGKIKIMEVEQDKNLQGLIEDMKKITDLIAQGKLKVEVEG